MFYWRHAPQSSLPPPRVPAFPPPFRSGPAAPVRRSLDARAADRVHRRPGPKRLPARRRGAGRHVARQRLPPVPPLRRRRLPPRLGQGGGRPRPVAPGAGRAQEGRPPASAAGPDGRGIGAGRLPNARGHRARGRSLNFLNIFPLRRGRQPVRPGPPAGGRSRPIESDDAPAACVPRRSGRAGRTGARRRHFGGRPLGRPRGRHRLRGRGGVGLRPRLGLRGRSEPGGDQRPCRRPGGGGRGRGDRGRPVGRRQGHSGGPLLDQCGRVLGVNTLITRNESGDSPFAFAVANRELTAFLREARQPFQAVTTECVSMADRLRQDSERGDAEARAREAAAASAALKARDERERTIAQVEESRENRLALAILCLALSLVAFGGAGIMLIKDRTKPAKILGGAGAALLLLAIVAFLARPSLAAAEAPAPAAAAGSASAPARFAGANNCRLVAERSRVTVSPTADVPLDWNENGCVNERTQYARNGDTWTRILVPNGEQAVSVLQFRPSTGEYVVTRYLLDAQAMARVRALRQGVEVKSCTADPEARTVLADQLRDIGAVLPHLPNERLVYACEHRAAAAAGPP